MRNKIKQILTVCFVIAAMAVVWNAPVWAGTATQAELTGTQEDIELNKEVTINWKRMVMKLITILHQQKTRDIYLF